MKMKKIEFKDLFGLFNHKTQIENVFSSILGFFILLLMVLTKICPEEQRVIGDLFISYVIVAFLILIGVMQASLRLQKVGRF